MGDGKSGNFPSEGNELTERVLCLRNIYFRAVPEICTERACLLTHYHLENGLLDKGRDRISILDKARAYRYVLENRAPIVIHHRACEKKKRALKPFFFEDAPLSFFAGSTTSKFKGVPLFPEFLGLALWPELWKITKRKSNPYHITDSEVEDLNYRVFPHWIENSISEIVRRRYFNGSRKSCGINEMELLERLVFFVTSKAECISHTIPDFSQAIKHGLRYIIDEAREEGRKSIEDSKRDFYGAICEVLEGIIAYSRNLAAEAEELAGRESDSDRREELREIARIHRQVPAYPARSFREGLTTIWICWIAIHLENPNIGLSLGRLDQVLYELYNKDICKKKITEEQATELVCCLWLKIGDHVPMVPEVAEELVGGTGSNQAITIGGVKGSSEREGLEHAVNDLTYVLLNATKAMKLRDPNLNARYHPDVEYPEKYFKALYDTVTKTGATPALHNDKAVIKALEARGDRTEHARDYGIIGCVEPGSNGRFYGHSAAILLNLTSALELALFQGKHRHTRDQQIGPITRAPEHMASFEEFKAAFKEQTCWLIKKATALNNLFGRVHQDFYPTPILSAFFEGPMRKGMDLIEGGAVINASGVAVIGLADVADSLTAIQRVVLWKGAEPGETRVPFKDLISALERNFEGSMDDRALQLRLSNPNKTPKYGNEDPMAEENVHEILKLLDCEFGRIENYRGGLYRVGYWTMTSHAAFGRLMKALPNGRKAYENLASGITPVSKVTPQLTGTLNSVAQLPTTRISSGMALNLKFPPKSVTSDLFASYVKGYFHARDSESEGGMEIQFNVIRREDLIDAYLHPEKETHGPPLLVRVSGYTAYFKDLNRMMQKEIIDRTEYDLSTGKMIPFDPIPLKEKRK